MRLSEYARIINGELIGLDQEVDVLFISTDSRHLFNPKKTFFFAIKTEKNDGHKYVDMAFAAGVVACIVSKKIASASGSFIHVADTLEALHLLAKWKRENYHYPIIALTGSNGKTICKEWLAGVLETSFRVVKSPKSYNSQIGVPLSVWRMEHHHNLGIFETGISKKGEMQALEKIIQPDYVLFTNLGTAHDDGFENKEQKAQEKLILAKNAKHLILQYENDKVRALATHLFPEKLITWSFFSAQATYFFSIAYPYVYYKNERVAELSESSEVYLENIGHVLALSIILHLSSKEILEGTRKLRNVPMRLEIKEGINQCILVDDTYTNDTAGLLTAIHYVSQLKQRTKKTLICSDLSDTDSLLTHRQVLESAKASGIQRIIAIGPVFQQLKNEWAEITALPSIEYFLAHFPSFDHELVLVKGARKDKAERIVSALQAKSHRTYLEVNFEALLHNVNVYKSLISPTVKTMAMMKAMAYGSGNLEIASILQFHGIDYLGVAFTDEAVALRQNGIHLPLLVMNPDMESHELLLQYDLEPEIYSVEYLKGLAEKVNKGPLKIHLKIETGMNRLGIQPDQITEVIDWLSKNKHIEVKAVFTHFAASDDPNHDAYTQMQATLFLQSYAQLAEALGYKPLKHAVNSSGIVRWPQFHWDMVRLGIGLHGYDPTGQLPLHYLSTLRSYVTQVKEVPESQTVGYGRRGKIASTRKIAIVPIGYADGYRRDLGEGKGQMMIRGNLHPTIGSVCMDMTMLDITGTTITAGDEVVVFGQNPTIEQLADWAGTIPYEILTGISSRVKRIYVSE